MCILAVISKYSTILMPVLSLVGFVLPNVSNTVLPWLAGILFFLMFFTLLGINQNALMQKLMLGQVWRFAILQNMLICFFVTIIAYAVGIRGDFLLAVAAVGATAPLFGSGAIVNAMGFDALLAMAKTIAATLLMPITLWFVLWLLADDNAYLDMAAYVKRLVTYIICPILLSILVRRLLPVKVLASYYTKIAQFNVLLVLAFPLGLMGGFRQTFDNDPKQALLLFIVAAVLVIFVFIITVVVYLKTGKQPAVIAATVSSGRNVLLTYTIALPFVGSMFLPLVGALQLPMFSVPFFAKLLLHVKQKDKQNDKQE